MAENKILSDEQYKTLMEGSNYFEQFEKTGYVNNINPFLGKLQNVYSDFYNSPLNINCNTCLTGALSKLWHHMGVKRYLLEQEAIKKESEAKLKENEQRPKEGIKKGK
jgi:hypothetical protein